MWAINFVVAAYFGLSCHKKSMCNNGSGSIVTIWEKKLDVILEQEYSSIDQVIVNSLKWFLHKWKSNFFLYNESHCECWSCGW